MWMAGTHSVDGRTLARWPAGRRGAGAPGRQGGKRGVPDLPRLPFSTTHTTARHRGVTSPLAAWQLPPSAPFAYGTMPPTMQQRGDSSGRRGGGGRKSSSCLLPVPWVLSDAAVMLSLVGLLLTMALVLALRASTQSPYENLQAFPSIGKSVVDRAHPLIPRKSGHIEVVDAQQSDDDDDDDGVDIDVAEQFSLSPSLDQGLWGAILALRDMYEGPTVDDDARPFRTDSAEAWMQAGGNATEPACRSAFLSCFSTPDLAKWDAYERWNRFVHYKDVMEEHRHYLVNHGRYVRSKEPDSCPFVDKSANALGAEPPALPHRLSPLAVHAEAAVATYYRHRAVSDDGTEPEFQPLYGPAIAPFGRSKPMPPMPPSSFAEKHGFHGGDLQQSGEGGMRFNGTAVYEKVLRTLCPGVLCGIPVEVSGFAYYPPGAFREWHTNRLDVIAREMRHDEKAGGAIVVG